jgi:hypothetical protein
MWVEDLDSSSIETLTLQHERLHLRVCRLAGSISGWSPKQSSARPKISTLRLLDKTEVASSTTVHQPLSQHATAVTNRLLCAAGQLPRPFLIMHDTTGSQRRGLAVLAHANNAAVVRLLDHGAA